MARTIRISYYLKENNLGHKSQYEKQIYIKNNTWHPPPAPLHIEDRISSFEKLLKEKHNILVNKHKQRNLLNLTPLQKKVFDHLKQNHNIIIKPTDKNLGPAIMDTEDYIQQVLKDHLLTKDYMQLTQYEALSKMEKIKNLLKDIISTNKNSLSEAEQKYFQRSLKDKLRLPIFYGLPKVHKTPLSLRPVVSSSSSLLSIFSNWLDYRMKELLPLIKSYTKNSFDVIKDLKQIDLPENALLFSADAKSMYTNIDSTTGLLTFQHFLEENSNKISADFPTSLFLKILEIVMRNNIFTFSDTYWLQLAGTAMGTPAACAYATITFGHLENTKILPKFHSQLLLYRRYIDDIFAIWLPPPIQQTTTWNNFKNTLNSWGSLEWIIENPSTKTVFLDLHIEIKNKTIHTSTYQKALNLYLYITPRSAHPPSCLKGLISGELRRYWLQNDKDDFSTILVKFIQRLTYRGHNLDDITPILLQAAAKLDSITAQNPNKDDKETLFIHWTFYRNGLQRTDIRNIYNDTLSKHLSYDKMTVAIARPRNLRDILCRAALPPSSYIITKNIISKLTADNSPSCEF
jgi:hypothetical protein